MDCEYVENGRYQQPTIWIEDFRPLGQYPYPLGGMGVTMIALTRTQAIELRQELSKAIKMAVEARDN